MLCARVYACFCTQLRMCLRTRLLVQCTRLCVRVHSAVRDAVGVHVPAAGVPCPQCTRTPKSTHNGLRLLSACYAHAVRMLCTLAT
jgi:hypothetical protein